MTVANVSAFLRHLASHPDLLADLNTQPKDMVIKHAAELGFGFSEEEFNTTVWGAEERLATFRGEKFDATFPLWDLMWGRYYLDYLVNDLLPSCIESGILN